MYLAIIPTQTLAYHRSSLLGMAHRPTENVHEPVDKLWKGVASSTLMHLSPCCLIFNRPVINAMLYYPLPFITRYG